MARTSFYIVLYCILILQTIIIAQVMSNAQEGDFSKDEARGVSEWISSYNKVQYSKAIQCHSGFKKGKAIQC